MKMRLAAAFLLISLALAFSNTPLEVVVLSAQVAQNGSARPPISFQLGGSTAYAIVSGTEIQGFILPSNTMYGYYIATTPGEIEGALQAYYLMEGYSPEALSQFSAVHDGITRIKRTRDSGEAACRVLTGADRTPCTDFDSCQKACYTVTSFCLPMALGAGRPFIDTIWLFENDSSALTSAYAAEADAYSAVSQNASQYNALAYLSSLVGINRAATSASQSQLDDEYSSCFSPDYSLPAITRLQQAAQKAYQNASRFYSIVPDAQAIANRTLSGMASYAAQQALLAASNNSSLGNATIGQLLPSNLSGNASGTGNSSSPQAPSQQPQVPLAAFAVAIGVCCAAAWFVLSRKKRKGA